METGNIKPYCSICKNTGVLCVFNTNINKTEIQRCDTCMMFKNDIDAWKSLKPKSTTKRFKLFKTVDGKELWMRIFNTDFEEAVLSHFELEKNFDDDGTDEQNKEIVDALDGMTLENMIDIRCQWFGYGMDSGEIIDMFDQLQISKIEELQDDD